MHGESWEVLFTGSVAWKKAESKGKGNKRSHKLDLGGPHFVFVREAKLVGKPIAWNDIWKFHAQLFFDKGYPAARVYKANLAAALLLGQNFMREVINPHIWSDVKLVKLVRQPTRTKKRKLPVSLPEVPVQDAHANTVKRTSRRLRDRKKTGVGVGVGFILPATAPQSSHMHTRR